MQLAGWESIYPRWVDWMVTYLSWPIMADDELERIAPLDGFSLCQGKFLSLFQKIQGFVRLKAMGRGKRLSLLGRLWVTLKGERGRGLVRFKLSFTESQWYIAAFFNTLQEFVSNCCFFLFVCPHLLCVLFWRGKIMIYLQGRLIVHLEVLKLILWQCNKS